MELRQLVAVWRPGIWIHGGFSPLVFRIKETGIPERKVHTQSVGHRAEDASLRWSITVCKKRVSWLSDAGLVRHFGIAFHIVPGSNLISRLSTRTD